MYLLSNLQQEGGGGISIEIIPKSKIESKLRIKLAIILLGVYLGYVVYRSGGINPIRLTPITRYRKGLHGKVMGKWSLLFLKYFFLSI